jgi:hypothetical protein
MVTLYVGADSVFYTFLATINGPIADYLGGLLND